MSHQNNKYYLYRHIRLDKNEVFYVGIGQKYKHYTSYEKEYRRAFDRLNRTNYWHNIVNLNPDYEVEILMESNDYNFIREKEIEFIAKYGRIDLNKGTLVNLTDGGDGRNGAKASTKTKLKLSKRMIKLRDEGKLGFFTKSKKVYQYTLDGNFIKEWSSYREASLYYNNTTILKTNNNINNKTAAGYVWKNQYLGEKIDINIQRKDIKLVYQYTKSGKFVEKWNTIHEIVKNLGIPKTTLQRCIYGYNKTSNGYIWSFDKLAEDKTSNNLDETSK